jgi:hypothetical protein
MSKNFAETRLKKARSKLFSTIDNLEYLVQRKVKESTIQAKMIDVSEEYDSDLKMKIVEQDATIENLNSEINNLQRELERAGVEIEFLNERNKIAIEKMTKMQNRAKQIIEEIESDLVKISDTINHK